MITPEIPPPPKLPSLGTSRAPQWAIGIVIVVTALGGGAGLRALFGQGEEQIRQSAEILAKLDTLAKSNEAHAGRIDSVEGRERQNFQRNEAAFATLFAALAREGYEPPREAPKDSSQITFQSTRNAVRPVRASENDGRAMSIPKASPPPGL